MSGVSQKFKSLWPVLHASDEMKEVFKDTKPLISFRRPRNLADNLVRSKIKGATNTRKDKGMKVNTYTYKEVYTYKFSWILH